MARQTAGELANKALSDKTKYNAREVAHAVSEDIIPHLYESVAKYKDKIEQKEFCVVMVIATDPLIHNLKRRKFYCWPWLPSPRPNQAVFLYNKSSDLITKRLWVLPCAQTMAELATDGLKVCKEYETMQAWSFAFFKGTFWEYIRYESDIKMLSQQEDFALTRNELRKAGIDMPDFDTSQPFDFSKIATHNVTDTAIATL